MPDTGFYCRPSKESHVPLELITQDPFTLRAIQHYNIEFAETLVLQTTNKTYE